MRPSLQLSRMAGLVACLFATSCAPLFLAAQTAPTRRILVYTRNYTPDGKGYVHDNIAASVAAIRKMGDEAGFAVDEVDAPGVFTDESLRQYAELVFSNSNNEAFSDTVVRLLDKVVQHLFRDFEVGDHAVLHRLDGHDVARRAPKHILGLFAYGFHFACIFIDGHNRGLIHNDALAGRVN